MLATAFALIAVPLARYALGVAGAALHPRRDSPLTALAAIRGAAVLILVTWIGARGPGEPEGAVVPRRRDLPMLGVATVLLSAWMAPITRHGIGSIGTGNHADLPSPTTPPGRCTPASR